MKRKTKEEREAEKRYAHSMNVVKVFNDIDKLVDLFIVDQSIINEINDIMLPYAGNGRYWDFVIHTAADNPKLHNEIKKIVNQ
jgi:hypothetical protein